MDTAVKPMENVPENPDLIPQEPELDPEKAAVRAVARKIGYFIFVSLTEASAEEKSLVDTWKVLVAYLLLFNIQIKVKGGPVDKRKDGPARQTFFVSIGHPLQMSSFSLPVPLGIHFKGLSWNVKQIAKRLFVDNASLLGLSEPLPIDQFADQKVRENALSLAKEIALRI